MDKMNNILKKIQEHITLAAETYKGQKRSDLKDSDFLFPATRSFPIVTPQDVKDAISNFGRMKGDMTYEAFLRKLYNKCKNKGPEFVAALPEASKEQLGINKKKTKASIFCVGDEVRNINSSCIHYGSQGVVTDIRSLPDRIGDVVYYRTINAGEYWNQGDILRKTESQLAHADVMMMQHREPSTIMDMPDGTSETMSDADPNRLQEPVFQVDPIPIQQDMADDELPDESPSEVSDFSMEEEAMIMAITSLKSTCDSLSQILSNLNNPNICDNLTEPWLIGKIAIVEDYVNTIRTYVMYASENEEDNTEAGSKPGLWENIRKKRERMGKNYKPAKPGDKGRPDPSQWNKLTK